MWNDEELARVDRAVAELNFSGRADLIRDLVLEAIERRTATVPYLGGGHGKERLLDT
jgi:metal-responsive CopG/Arc/MetJ family transcriptional regulator